MGNQYYIIRCKEAGVFFGHIKSREGGAVIRRLIEAFEKT